jgi:hypothetical protein
LNRFQYSYRSLGTAVYLFILVFLFGNAAFAQLNTLYATGNQLATAISGGCTLHLKGVDIDGLEFSPYGYGPGGSSANCGGFTGNSTNGCGGDTLAAVTEAITAWHVTVIRLPLNQDFWFGCSNAITQISASQYQSAVSTIVNYCDSRNVYVVMDLHWSGTYGGTTPTTPGTGAGWGTAIGQQEMADANAVTFWGSVASQSWTKNNPAVLFDLYNEPNNLPSWSVWFNGGGTGGTPAWTPGMQGLLNAVRSVGANNICLLGGMSYCADLTGVISGPGPVTNMGNGVIYSAHLYGSNDGTTAASWNGEVPSSVLSAVPVFLGEFGGTTSCGTGGSPNAEDNATFDTNMIGSSGWAVTTTGVVGSTAWSFTDDSCPNQLTNWTWTPNAWGAAVSTWLATPNPTCPPATPTFTPNLTYTPTTTSTSTPTLSPTNTPNPCARVYEAINCGGPQEIIGGVTWQADQAYSAGGFGYVTAGLANTVANTIVNSGAQQALYQSERYATPLEYKFTVPNGTYMVTLKNTELYWTASGQRVFSVAINGTTVLSNFDIFAEVGEFVADDHSFMVNVIGGLIDIVATATVDNAQFGAIEITNEIACTPANTPTQTATNSPTSTSTNSPTSTSTNTSTHTATSTATNTATLTATNTATGTATNTITGTIGPSDTATNTSTNTPSSTMTNTSTSTATATATHTSTNTTSATATNSSTNTVTQTATNTPTLTPVITSTFTNTVTSTSSSTATKTSTNTASSTASNSPTNTSTHTVTNSPTLTPISTSTVTNTITNTASSTATETSTSTASSTVSNSPTITATQTATNTATKTPTVTSTYSKTNTPTATSTNTPTITATNTLTPLSTSTKTSTPSFTSTSTITPTYTPTISPRVVISPPYPNPSSGSPMTFNVQTPDQSTVTLEVFTPAFRKIYSQTFQVYGSQNLQWNLRDNAGIRAADGIYYVRVHVAGAPATTKILKVLILR